VFKSGINALRKYWRNVLQRKSFLSLLLIGILNGLLPCGMVYMALVSAITMDSPGQSMQYMFFYGLGTFPAMLSVGIGGQFLPLSRRVRLTKLTPWMMVIAGAILIFRGVDLPHALSGHPNEPIPVCGQK
jgi:sulfite exporter TauE/SafE